MYYAYILENAQGIYYIGQTNNLEERIRRHNRGGSQYSRGKGPWRLAYYEELPDRSSAVKREKELKAIRNKKVLKEIIEQKDF